MSSVTPSAGDYIHRNKTRNTNNSASQDLVTPLTTKRKGKGFSMMEEPDPEADSHVNVSPMPASGPVLTGPHPPDTTNPEEATSSSAAPQSAKRMPTASRSTIAQPGALKSVSNAKITKSNKTIRKPSTSNTYQPLSSKQQLSNEQNNSTWALGEDLLNLRASMQSETADNKTQASTLSQTEGKRDQNTGQAEHKESEYNAVFWDIEVAKDLPIWAEPITMSTKCIFGMFDPAVDEDILILMGVVDARSNRVWMQWIEKCYWDWVSLQHPQRLSLGEPRRHHMRLHQSWS